MGMYDDANEERQSGGIYMGNGTHDPVRLIEVDVKPTTRAGDPQLFCVWQNEQGATHKQWVWYDGSRGQAGLWRLLDLINACGVPLPQEGEYDEGGKGRLSMAYASKLINKPHVITLHKPDGSKYREVDTFERTAKTRFNFPTPSAQTELPVDTSGLTAQASRQDDDIPF